MLTNIVFSHMFEIGGLGSGSSLCNIHYCALPGLKHFQCFCIFSFLTYINSLKKQANFNLHQLIFSLVTLFFVVVANVRIVWVYYNISDDSTFVCVRVAVCRIQAAACPSFSAPAWAAFALVGPLPACRARRGQASCSSSAPAW